MILKQRQCNFNIIIALILILTTSCQINNSEETPMDNQTTPYSSTTFPAQRLNNLIPKPVSVAPGSGLFRLTKETQIIFEPADDEAKQIGQYLANLLQPSTGFFLQLMPAQAGE
jgi:hexosaminidase